MPPRWAVFFFSSIEGKTLYTREYYTHEYIRRNRLIILII